VKCLIGDGTSCANCERLGFTCSFADTSPQGDGENTQVSLPRRRVRLACINCHSRKARCSGETPTCARCQSQGIECVYRPTKRSGAVAGQAGNSDHESVSSEPPEKRRMTNEDACARNGRLGNNDNAGMAVGYSSWPPNHEPLADFNKVVHQRNVLISNIGVLSFLTKPSSQGHSTTSSVTYITCRFSPSYIGRRSCSGITPG
jgi:hypothetical protein